MKKTKKEECAVCYEIFCAECGWHAKDEDVLKIQKEELTACPLCGWKPKDKINLPLNI